MTVPSWVPPEELLWAEQCPARDVWAEELLPAEAGVWGEPTLQVTMATSLVGRGELS